MIKRFLQYSLLAFLSFLPLEALQIVKQEFVFTAPPFASCHASTLTQTHSGNLLCAWFAGTEEGNEDVAIWLSTMDQQGWSSPRKIAEAEGVPCWNPVLFTMPSGQVLLFYKAGKHPQQWSGLLKRSLDEGRTWSEAEDLPAGVIGAVKNKPLLLEDGNLLCGSSIESWKRWGCWIDMTSDVGKSWSKSAPINVEGQLFGIIQPALFYGQKGVIKMLTRSRDIGFICTAESHDSGKTWSKAKATSLPNPNSAIDAINTRDGKVLLVYNDSKKERYPLNVATSEDRGESWKMQLILEKNPGEYSYPSIIQSVDGKIHITYTWNRELIRHVVLDPAS